VVYVPDRTQVASLTTLVPLSVIVGDTDTCGAITGALIGAFYGLEKMEANQITRENIEVLMSSKSDMPDHTEAPRPRCVTESP